MSTVKSLKLPANISLFMKDSILLFKKDQAQLCVQLPEELVFHKTGSTLMLALRNETTEGQSKILLGTWFNILSNILYGLSRGFHTNLLLYLLGEDYILFQLLLENSRHYLHRQVCKQLRTAYC